MGVRVKELPPYHVAYMCYVGPYGAYGIPELWTRFDKWMEARGLRPEARITLGVGYDDPRITAAEQCRYDACRDSRGLPAMSARERDGSPRGQRVATFRGRRQVWRWDRLHGRHPAAAADDRCRGLSRKRWAT
jgi:hypothetical protein